MTLDEVKEEMKYVVLRLLNTDIDTEDYEKDDKRLLFLMEEKKRLMKRLDK